MATPFLGQIISVGFGFAPVGWYPCDGRLLPVSENTALYQLLGTMYGGDGINTFALPNLNGRVPLGQGQGQGLSNYVQGQVQGTESVTLTAGQTPNHTHAVTVSKNDATGITPKPADGAKVTLGVNTQTALKGLYTKAAGTNPLIASTITPFMGGSQPHENRQPFVVLNYIIAYAGIYPSQN